MPPTTVNQSTAFTFAHPPAGPPGLVFTILFPEAGMAELYQSPRLTRDTTARTPPRLGREQPPITGKIRLSSSPRKRRMIERQSWKLLQPMAASVSAVAWTIRSCSRLTTSTATDTCIVERLGRAGRFTKTSLGLVSQKVDTDCSASTAIYRAGSTGTVRICPRTARRFLMYLSIQGANGRLLNRRLAESKGSPEINYEEVIIAKRP